MNPSHLWHGLINSQPIKMLYLLNNGWFTTSETDPIFIWVTSKNLETISSNESTLCIKQGKVKELDALYLLDMSSEEANKVRRSYGVYCASVSSDPKEVLSDSSFANTWENTNGVFRWKNWKCIFEQLYNGPSNALVIVDRWFFDNYTRPKVKKQIYNLFDILDSILPKESLQCQYQILMYFEKPMQIKNFSALSKSIIKVVKDVISKLKQTRTYDIRFEAIINIDNGIEFRNATHNRIMLTNYSYVGGQQEWKIFSNDEDPLETQLTFQELLYVNKREKASTNYSIKLSALVDFTKAFFSSCVKHINNMDLGTFKYAWIINDKLYLLKQSSDGKSIGIEEIDENGNSIVHDNDNSFLIQNRIIHRHLT